MGERNRGKRKNSAYITGLILLAALLVGKPDGFINARETLANTWETPHPAENDNVAETPTVEPTIEPAPEPELTPIPTPQPTPTAKYVLQSPKAKYKKGGQQGIRYRKVSGRKVYQLHSYTTDVIQLKMSHASTYTVYGGGSKKEVRKSM